MTKTKDITEDKLGLSWVSQLAAEKKKFNELLADARIMRELAAWAGWDDVEISKRGRKAITEFDKRWGKN